MSTSCESTKTNSKEEAIAYFVRHAEKADDGSKNPPLTDDGLTRAKKLADMLEDKNIKSIYSTDYDRTKSTAIELADRLGQEVKIYVPSDTNFVNNIKMELSKGSILIVGHSNSTPTLVNAVLQEDKYQNIEESDYGNIFLVKNRKGNLTSEVIKY
jgi:broad specificity phosphatase PhoE